jgi:inward rectifier potassium channel
MSRSQPPAPRKLVDPQLRRTIVRTGAPPRVLGDAYHALLNAHWSVLLAIFATYYVVANVLFALAYLAGGDDLAHAHSFTDDFFFSVQTLATIGYGSIAPKTLYANILVAIEAFTGVLGFALATGLFFAKFSRPTARVLFSRVAVVTARDGVPSLMLRLANERANQVVEAQVHIALALSETTAEGEQVRRFYDLALTRTRTPIFVLSWTVVHPITETSPLYGATHDSLMERDGEVIVSVTGIDETFSQAIHARYSYLADEIIWGARFADIMSQLPDGRRHIDYGRFHDIVRPA